MSWYHQQCVSVGKDDPTGICLCLSCSSVPENIQNEISSLKNNVNQLKTTTELILSSMNKLSTQLEKSIGGINDRMTAVTRQINVHDIIITEAIENVPSKTASLKSSVDQKTNQIRNKTTAVFNKIKTFENSVKKNLNAPTYEPSLDRSQVAQNQKPIQSKKTVKPKVAGSSAKLTSHDKNQTDFTWAGQQDKRPDQQQKKRKKQTKKQQQKNPNWNLDTTIDENECIDLTKTYAPRNTIKQSTLLIGSFILKNEKEVI